MLIFAPKTAYRAKLDGTWAELACEIASLSDEAAVAAWEADFILRRHRTLPEYWQESIREALADRLTALKHHDMDEAFRLTVGPPGSLISPRRKAP